VPGLFGAMEALSLVLATDFGIYAPLKRLAMDGVRRGEEARARGEHERALRRFEEVAHLGHLMRVKAYMTIEGWVGVAITSMVVDSFLSEEKSRQIEREVSDPQAQRERKDQAGTLGFAAYTRRYGRGDLGRFYEQDAGAGQEWFRECKKAIGASVHQYIRLLSGTAALVATAGRSRLRLTGMRKLLLTSAETGSTGAN